MFWQVTFEGIVRSSVTGDIAIDDFFFTGGSCPFDGKYFDQRVYLHVFWEEKRFLHNNGQKICISSFEYMKILYVNCGVKN